MFPSLCCRVPNKTAFGFYDSEAVVLGFIRAISATSISAMLSQWMRCVQSYQSYVGNWGALRPRGVCACGVLDVSYWNSPNRVDGSVE